MRICISVAGLLLISVSVLAQSNPSISAYDEVNPFVGTAEDGNTFPGATLPFGMLQWSPDTAAEGWYHYSDKTIRGFSLTHISGAGCPVYADVPILPWNGELGKSPKTSDEYALAFSHEKEQAHPGYYSVEFENGIRAELAVSARAGIGRFVFPEGAVRTLLFKAGDSANSDNPKRASDTSTVQIHGNDTVEGTVHSGGFCESDTNYVLYFVVKFAKPFSSFGTWDDAVNLNSASSTGHKVGAYVSFAAGSEPIVMKVGVSFVSVANATANLAAEIPEWDFDAVHAAAKASWVETLGRVQADGGTPEQRAIFYTGLYHMLLTPSIFSDENGDYIGFDDKVRRLPNGEEQYANFSDWDIYRDVVQFQSLMFPARTSQMMQSLVRDAEQSGWLPRWPVANDVSYVMGGDSSSILLSTAYAFGARGFDTKSALQFMVKGATVPGTGLHGGSERPGLADYLSKGYVPTSTGTQEAGASITLEYANADFAVSRFAAAMGDHDHRVALLRSAQNWRKLLDSESGFIRPRTSDGNFLTGWDPDTLMPRHTNWDKKNQLGFEEGSTWQYTWMIPFNYAGLFQAIGGDNKVIPRLDSFFEKLTGWGGSKFTVENEPDFVVPYAYVWTGNPWKTQGMVDRIRRETFANKPDGLPGNDDLGATSGVYVWNALGMYPAIPGVGGLVLGTPMFTRATIQMSDGRTLEIDSRGEGIYVQSVQINGKPYTSAWLPLTALSAKRNRLEIVLGQDPNWKWGAGKSALPPSFEAPGK
jgi:predicted alpha-1,2-mannosidase